MNNVVGEGVVLNYITYIAPERLGIGIRENFRGSVSFKGTVYVIAFDLARSFHFFYFLRSARINFMFSYDSLKSFISLTSSAAGNSIWSTRKMN